VSKQLERVLQILHGEYVFDPVVPEAQKQWWYETSLRFLQDYCRFFSEAETCQKAHWHRWWSIKTYRDEDDKKGYETNTSEFGVVEHNQSVTNKVGQKDQGSTMYWVTWLGFTTTFTIGEVAEKDKWAELIERGVPPHLIKYCYDQLIQR
jgi:hypothetical protein